MRTGKSMLAPEVRSNKQQSSLPRHKPRKFSPDLPGEMASLHCLF